jgi:hypothetical protein
VAALPPVAFDLPVAERRAWLSRACPVVGVRDLWAPWPISFQMTGQVPLPDLSKLSAREPLCRWPFRGVDEIRRSIG